MNSRISPSFYSVWWIFAICASFYFVKIDNLRFLIWTVSDAGRWPITVFSGWIRWLLTTLLPIAVITSFPAMALRGQIDASHVAWAAGVAAAFLVTSRIAWKRSLGAYTSASS